MRRSSTKGSALNTDQIIVSMLTQADMVRQSVAAGYRLTAEDKRRIAETENHLIQACPE